MRALVLGYHNVGCVGLKALLRNGFDVPACFTHLDDPNEDTWFDSLAEKAAQENIRVYAPLNINEPYWVEKIKSLEPDMIFSFYYRNMIGQEILDIPKKGCFNLHGSFLPYYRGRCPINWVLVNGEKRTGATLHHMTLKPDQGDIVDQQAIEIEPSDIAFDLHHKLAKATSVVLDRALPLMLSHKTPHIPQDHSKASYFGGRKPKDGEINWQKSAKDIHNLVRAVAKPYPGAFSHFKGEKFLVWQSEVVESSEKDQAAKVLSLSPLVISCSSKALKINVGQKQGGVVVPGFQLAEDLGLEVGQIL